MAPSLGLDFRPRSPWRRVTIALLVLGLLGSALALWQRYRLLEQRAALASLLEARRGDATRGQPARAAPEKPEAIAEAERIVAGLQRPWEPMLNALQTAIRADVQVQRVQPETDVFRLRITGQADSSHAFVEFVQRLQADPSWRAVQPISEAQQPNAATTGGKPLVFQLTAEWGRP